MIDKSSWGPGPWQSEPDHVRWISPTGLRCEIMRSHITGALCGYAHVPRGHRYWGLSWRRQQRAIDVHGGVTFAAVVPGGRYAIGFDCAHYQDDTPALNALVQSLGMPPLPSPRFSAYRSLDYVHAETERLAAQIAAPRYSRCALCHAPKRTWQRQARRLCVRCSKN